MLEEFYKYVKSFDLTDPLIERKYKHSIRVMKLCDLIAKDNNFNDHDIFLANLIGLLHDFGRFEQWHNFNTFSDLKSFDHADFGVNILFKNNIIKRYTDDINEYELIYTAIKYHNKYTIPETLDRREEKFCKLVRDADKLDILNLVYIEDDLRIEDDNPISNNVKKAFLLGMPININDVHNKNDDIVLRLGMIYDLQYDFSIRYLKNSNIVSLIYKRIKNKERFKIYFDKIIEYIDNKYKEFEEIRKH